MSSSLELFPLYFVRLLLLDLFIFAGLDSVEQIDLFFLTGTSRILGTLLPRDSLLVLP